MASEVVNIRELINLVGFEVDEASAARVDAIMQDFESRVVSVGQAVAGAAGLVAEFVGETAAVGKTFAKINRAIEDLATVPVEGALLSMGSGIELVGTTAEAGARHLAAFTQQANAFAKVANRVVTAMDKVGGNMLHLANNSEFATTALKVATVQAGNLAQEMSHVGKEAWLASKKVLAVTETTRDMKVEQRLATKELEKANRAADAAAKKSKEKEKQEKKSAETSERGQRSTEKSIGLWGRFGLAVDGVRAAYDIVAGVGETLVGGFVTQGREMRTSAKVAGISTTAFQELAFAAKTVNFEADDLRDVFVDLSGKVKDGSDEQKKALKALGVEVKDTTTGKLKPMDEILLDLADGLANMEDSTDKTAYASALLGEQGSRLIPVLNKGRKGLRQMAAEARELGFVIDGDALKAGEDFELNTMRLSASLTGLRNVVATIVLPALDKLVRALTKMVKRWAPILKEDAKKWADRLEKSVEFLTEGVDKLRAALLLTAGVMLGKYLFALSTLTSAQTAWGVAALIAGARAAAAALLPVLPFIAIGALIALVVEDLYGFATGAESALGTFIDWVDKVDPEDNPLLNLLKRALSVLFDLTDTKKWKRFWEAAFPAQAWALMKALELAEKLFGVKNPFNSPQEKAKLEEESAAERDRRQRIGNRGALAGFFAGSYQTDVDAQIEREQKIEAEREKKRQAERRQEMLYRNREQLRTYGLSELPSGQAAMPAYFGAGASGATAVPSLTRAGSSVFAPSLNVQQNIQASPGMSAQEVGMSAANQALDRYDSETRAAYAAYSED